MHVNIIAEMVMTREHNSTIENARQRFKAVLLGAVLG